MSWADTCVACFSPSIGLTQLLYYIPRENGPYFPILEQFKTKENEKLFKDGYCQVCRACANSLLRQWRAMKKLPVKERKYKLWKDEKRERKKEALENLREHFLPESSSKISLTRTKGNKPNKKIKRSVDREGNEKTLKELINKQTERHCKEKGQIDMYILSKKLKENFEANKRKERQTMLELQKERKLRLDMEMLLAQERKKLKEVKEEMEHKIRQLLDEQKQREKELQVFLKKTRT